MRIVCCVLLTASLFACGFQLRGSYQLPEVLQQLQLDMAAQNSELDRTLRRALASANVELVDQGAVPTLVVGEVSHQRRVLAVDAAGNPREYGLVASVSVNVPDNATAYRLPARQLQVRRDYVFESTGVLSASDQETQLKVEMERELARRIMSVLRAAP